MKRNWKEYSPNEDSWEKIMKARGFDAQLEQNLKKLPAHTPSDFVWDAIQEKLEKKKRALIWPPFLTAASLTGLFLLAFYLIRQGAVVLETQNIPEQVLAEESSSEEKPSLPDPLIIESFPLDELPKVDSQEERKILRKTVEPIYLPKTTFTFESKVDTKPLALEPRGEYFAEKVTKKETLHQVTISWGLKQNKLQVITPFGKPDPSTTNKTQASKSSAPKLIITGDRN